MLNSDRVDTTSKNGSLFLNKRFSIFSTILLPSVCYPTTSQNVHYTLNSTQQQYYKFFAPSKWRNASVHVIRTELASHEVVPSSRMHVSSWVPQFQEMERCIWKVVAALPVIWLDKKEYSPLHANITYVVNFVCVFVQGFLQTFRMVSFIIIFSLHFKSENIFPHHHEVFSFVPRFCPLLRRNWSSISGGTTLLHWLLCLPCRCLRPNQVWKRCNLHGWWLQPRWTSVSDLPSWKMFPDRGHRPYL